MKSTKKKTKKTKKSAKKKMTPAEFKAAMLRIKNDPDPNPDCEHNHCSADLLLCDVLISLGYREGVMVYDSLEKWYG